jgi:hypothetical protein
MTIIHDTLILDQTAWDLVLDSAGNIAMASYPYAIAQDVASACRTFSGECVYNTDLGVRYQEDILGHLPPSSLISGELIAQGKTVSDVADISASFVQFGTDRKLYGQMTIIDTDGAALTIDLAALPA